MRKIAIFGKPGSGKSFLGKKLSEVTNIPLFQLDSMLYNADGSKIDADEFHSIHEDLMTSAQWVIEGMGTIESFRKRIAAADTLIYLNLPYLTSYWLVTKRLLKAPFMHPEGWPKGCSVFKGTIQSYKTLKLCPEFWNDDFLNRLNAMSNEKQVIVLSSLSDIDKLLMNPEFM